jgi:peptidoglycan/xylan/chitin deacetylase (PgdA/CDA1 family)
MKNRCCAFLFGLYLSLLPVYGEISFSGLDLSADNRLLFRVDSSGPLPQHAIFISRLTDLALQQITAFPERMELVGNGGVLLVRNSFGAVRIPVSGGLPRNIPGFPSFASGAAPGARPLDIEASPDGRWVLYVESRSPAYGDLVLLDTADGAKRIVTRNIEKPDRVFPARFSPDSRVFVYAKAGRIYYYAPGSAASLTTVDERFRRVGEGEISSTAWSGKGDFFYFRGNTLYRVRGADFFTRAVYADFLEVGSSAGKIPFDFDPAFDSFWIAPDARSVLLSRGGRTVFYYPLEAPPEETVLPYVTIPPGAFDINVLWSSGGLVTVLASIPGGRAPSPGPVKESRVAAWRLVAGGSGPSSFAPLETPLGSSCVLSPDGKLVLFWGTRGLALWDYVNWRPLRSPEPGPVYSCLWLGNSEYIRGDARRIERVSLAGGRRLLCLAGVSVYGFEEQAERAAISAAVPRILAGDGGVWYSTDGRNPWAETSGVRVRKASQASGRYRVYLERQGAGLYENLPMIRNIASVGTAALLPAIKAGGESPPPVRGSPVSAGPVVSPRGRREGPREVALCFDLYDDDTGLALALDALNRFGFKATFFLNGEFIRRNPAAARSIAEAGQEAASMFYAPLDFSDSRYRVTADFILRGLARNEDEYYEASGDELNLLWHPPFYRASAEIAAAAAAAGYLTVDRDVDPLDWVNREEAQRLGMGRRSSCDIIERVIEQNQPGSIIPIRLGLLSGGGNDYLFLRLNVLLDALVREGYRVTPVSAVIRRAR